MEKQVNSGVSIIPAVLGTREHVDSRKVFLNKSVETFK